ncbi:HEAT repeat domain-containing protein [Streptomyces sp. BH-SS-21]|uniref:HEAT repeat domain-containing protein n=1 Tax=Streptomyces liliiviolaceus TaxID=2823109 RepID=A0A941B8E1_9ACTN|nr:HEAT repeat domain-containing protein [Streptomyces liliiviolaceus]MBQ0851471.1 HEAT repeat domain-containing protein [Streptomyces liliiviolaceus]
MGTEQQIAYFLSQLTNADKQADPERRAAAAKGLGRIGRPEHAEALTEAAADPVPEVRASAALGLGRLGVPEADATVLPGLMRDLDPWVRRRASVAAIRLKLTGRAVTEAFVGLLDDPDHHLRINALDGLYALGVTGDVAAAARLLGDPEGAVWGRARKLLYRFREDPAVRAEVLRTAREGEGAARAQALQMLPGHCGRRLLDSLLTGLRDPSPEVRHAAARRLLDLKGRSVRDAWVEALRTERDPEVAGTLLSGLGWQGERRVTDLAVRWLGDPRAGRWAAGALGDLGTGTAVEHLRRALTDTELPATTRRAAALAVGRAGRWDAVWLLLPLLDDPGAEVRAGAVDGLGARVHDGLRVWERRPVADALTAHLASGRDATWRTCHALDGLTEALPALRRLADEAPSAEVRAAALRLLTGGDTAAPQYVRCFERGSGGRR